MRKTRSKGRWEQDLNPRHAVRLDYQPRCLDRLAGPGQINYFQMAEMYVVKPYNCYDYSIFSDCE